MKRTLIYKKWRESSHGVFDSHVRKHVTGHHRDLFLNADGSYTIVLEHGSYRVPAAQVLAYIEEF